jgi:predicted enzyme related to lactoylglutathione lyase
MVLIIKEVVPLFTIGTKFTGVNLKKIKMKHLVNWIEIPVANMERAAKFYTQVLGIQLQPLELGDIKYALFPSEDLFNNGTLVMGPYYTPSADGVVIYLDGGDDLSVILNRVATAGGTILVEKMHLSDEAGHIGMFMDSEGNRIGLQHM